MNNPFRSRKNFDVGELDRRITIQQLQTEKNEYGELAATEYTTVAETWAKVTYKDSLAKEEQLADKETAVTKTIFTIRYRKGIKYDKTLTILYEEQRHDITAVVEKGRKQYLEIQTELRE